MGLTGNSHVYPKMGLTGNSHRSSAMGLTGNSRDGFVDDCLAQVGHPDLSYRARS